MKLYGCRPTALRLMQRFERSMPVGHLFSAAILAASIAGLAAPASAQMVAGPPGGLRSVLACYRRQPMAAGMNMQQMQMAQMYMLYGMMGMGRGNVSTGVANPFVNGGFGMQGGGNPYLESPTDYGASSNRHGAAMLTAMSCVPNGPSSNGRPSWPRPTPPRSKRPPRSRERKSPPASSSILLGSCYPGDGWIPSSHRRRTA